MPNDETYYTRAVYTALRIGFLAVLLYWSVAIIKPFILPTVWGIIIAVAFYPLHLKLAKALAKREKLSAILLTLFALVLLIVPSLFFISSTANSLQNLAEGLKTGTLTVPPPPDKVNAWPLIGKPIYNIWLLFSQNMTTAIAKFSPQVKELAQALIGAASQLGMGLILFIISIILAGVFLTTAQKGEKAARSIFTTLIGDRGEEFTRLSGAIIRSVLQGVLLVAAIQAFLGGIGIRLIGIPGAGVWALLILILAIMQLPPLLILGPLAIYSFTVASTPSAIIFTVWSLLVSMSDAFLKPLFLGRGVDVPMLAVLLGAIGGMMYAGIIGLFVGAIILSIAYKVFEALLVEDILEQK